MAKAKKKVRKARVHMPNPALQQLDLPNRERSFPGSTNAQTQTPVPSQRIFRHRSR